MSTDEKIRELAEILEGVISAVYAIAPQHYQTHLAWLQERVVSISEEGAIYEEVYNQ